MSAHLNIEVLSTYLDDQVSSDERGPLEAHLRSCQQCQEKLTGLRRVSQRLAKLERSAPPAHVVQELAFFIARKEQKIGLAEKLERALGRVTLQLSLLPLFAVVVALALIAYLLSWGVGSRSSSSVPVIFDTTGTDAARSIESERSQGEGSTLPVVTDEPSFEAARQQGEVLGIGTISPEVREIAGRRFKFIDGIWLEEGLVDSESPVASISRSQSEYSAWLDNYPELGELEQLEGAIRLRLDGDCVEIILTPRSDE